MPHPIAIAAKSLPWRYILPGIGAIVAVAGALWFAFDTGRDNMRAKLQPRINLLTEERDTARANVATLKGALDGQNKAIALAGQLTKQAQDMAADAAKGGREREKAMTGLMGRLDAVRASEGRCVTPEAVHEVWGKM